MAENGFGVTSFSSSVGIIGSDGTYIARYAPHAEAPRTKDLYIRIFTLNGCMAVRWVVTDSEFDDEPLPRRFSPHHFIQEKGEREWCCRSPWTGVPSAIA